MAAFKSTGIEFKITISEKQIDPKVMDRVVEPNIFLRICTHTQTITISIDLCPPIA
jgi:hypothetical protein